MNLKSIGQLLKQVVQLSLLIKGPLALIVVVVMLSFVLCLVWAPKVAAAQAPMMIGAVLIGCMVLSIIIVMLSLKGRLERGHGPSDESLNMMADDLGHKIYMSVTMYFSNFSSAEERIEAYKTLVTSITIGADEDSTAFRERMARRIRENVRLYEKTEI